MLAISASSKSTFSISLAPSNCLQYFTAATGKVSSFNWKDVAAGTTRQLNNQDYNICFRSAIIDPGVNIIFFYEKNKQTKHNVFLLTFLFLNLDCGSNKQLKCACQFVRQQTLMPAS